MERVGLLAGLLALAAALLPGVATGQDDTYTLDELEQACVDNTSDADQKDACLLVVDQYLAPESAAPSLAPDDTADDASVTRTDGPAVLEASAVVEDAKRDLPSYLHPDDCMGLLKFVQREESGPAWEAAQYTRYENCFVCSALERIALADGDEIAETVYLARCTGTDDLTRSRQMLEPTEQPDQAADPAQPTVRPVIPLPTPKPKKLPKPDYRAVADGKNSVFGPGEKERFEPKTLKVWVDGERVEPTFIYSHHGTFEIFPRLKAGAVVQATYQPQKVPKPDYRTVANGKKTVFGPGDKEHFEPKTLKVWVDGGRVWPSWVSGNSGKFEFYNPPEAGAVVQATYKPLQKVRFKRTLRGNGSDDFFVTLPKQVSFPTLRFTVRSDNSAGCSAYVYVREFGSWEPQDNLGMSFDGYKTKTRTQKWSDFDSGRNRVWVSTNCPWTLVITDTYWKKRS